MVENIAAQQSLSRLRWQCRRGMLELDELLAGFLNKAYGKLPAEQRQTFVQILSLPDQVLFDYLLGQTKPSDRDVASVIQQIRHSAGPQS